MPNPITITISAEAVAWYAAFVSTLVLIIQFLSYLEDKPRVKVKCLSGYRVYNAEPQYKSNTDYIVITVINTGKRPVTIKNVGFIPKNKKDKSGILGDALRYSLRELTEGKSADYLLEENSVDLSKIKYFVAYDATDREYKGKLKKQK